MFRSLISQLASLSNTATASRLSLAGAVERLGQAPYGDSLHAMVGFPEATFLFLWCCTIGGFVLRLVRQWLERSSCSCVLNLAYYQLVSGSTVHMYSGYSAREFRSAVTNTCHSPQSKSPPPPLLEYKIIQIFSQKFYVTRTIAKVHAKDKCDRDVKWSGPLPTPEVLLCNNYNIFLTYCTYSLPT